MHNQPRDFKPPHKRHYLLLESIYKCMQEDKQCTFSPETGTAAHVLAASQQPHARESFLDKVERLATLDKQKQDACREATAEHYYA